MKWRDKVKLIILFMLLNFFISPTVEGRDKTADTGALVLIYHHLVPVGTKVNYSSIILDTPEFEEQIKYLDDNDYNVISLSELYDLLKTKKEIPPRTVVITFDDGYKSNYVYAYPILQKHNFKASINLHVRTIKEKNYESFNPEISSKLSWEEVREMKNSELMEFHSHTLNMHRYGPVDRYGFNKAPVMITPIYNPLKGRKETREEYVDRVYKDLVMSKKIMEKKLNSEVYAFTYPYGAYNNVTQLLAQKAGYKMILTTKPGVNKRGDSVLLIKRVNVERGSNFPALLNKWLGPGQNVKVGKIPVSNSGLLLRQMEKGNTILR